MIVINAVTIFIHEWDVDDIAVTHMQRFNLSLFETNSEVHTNNQGNKFGSRWAYLIFLPATRKHRKIRWKRTLTKFLWDVVGWTSPMMVDFVLLFFDNIVFRFILIACWHTHPKSTRIKRIQIKELIINFPRNDLIHSSRRRYVDYWAPIEDKPDQFRWIRWLTILIDLNRVFRSGCIVYTCTFIWSYNEMQQIIDRAR